MSVCVCLHACEAATLGSVILEVAQQSFHVVQRHLFTVSLYLMFWQPLQTAQALGPSGSRMFVAWLVFSPILVRFVALGGSSNDKVIWHFFGAGDNGCACSPGPCDSALQNDARLRPGGRPDKRVVVIVALELKAVVPGAGVPGGFETAFALISGCMGMPPFHKSLEFLKYEAVVVVPYFL